MDESLLGDVMQSLKEAKAIAKGEIPASRRLCVTPTDVKDVREKTGLSQPEFAHLMQVSVRTLQNWEQRRRTPTGRSFQTRWTWR